MRTLVLRGSAVGTSKPTLLKLFKQSNVEEAQYRRWRDYLRVSIFPLSRLTETVSNSVRKACARRIANVKLRSRGLHLLASTAYRPEKPVSAESRVDSGSLNDYQAVH